MQYRRLLSRKIAILTLVLAILPLTLNPIITEAESISVNDAYANSFINNESYLYKYGENALGPSDGEFAIITIDYDEGYLTVDMGEGEDIVDGSGMDFTVVAQGGRYIVSVSNPGQPMKRLGNGNGNQSYDLASLNLFNARYVKIQFLSGVDVEIDAIVAINFITGDSENENPRIYGPEDFEVRENTSITLTWRTFDVTPKNYSILFNNKLIDSGPWDGSDIFYEFIWSTSSEIQITLILFDGFGNRAEDSVIIEIRPNPSTTPTTTRSTTPTTSTSVSTASPPSTAEMNYVGLVLLLGITLALAWRSLIQQKR